MRPRSASWRASRFETVGPVAAWRSRRPIHDEAVIRAGKGDAATVSAVRHEDGTRA
jgi:hypothetical protein